MWTTDKERLCYVIFDVINDVEKWHVDKGGLLVTKKIMKPIVDFIKDIIMKYIDTIKEPKYVKKHNMSHLYVAKQIKNCLELEKYIDAEHLTNDIHKYIADHFYVDQAQRTIKKKQILLN
jgi:hypothetical protein